MLHRLAWGLPGMGQDNEMFQQFPKPDESIMPLLKAYTQSLIQPNQSAQGLNLHGLNNLNNQGYRQTAPAGSANLLAATQLLGEQLGHLNRNPSNSGSDEDDGNRQERLREKNRNAQRRFREKQRATLSQLQVQVDQYRKQLDDLDAEKKSLQDANEELQRQIDQIDAAFAIMRDSGQKMSSMP